MNKFLNMITPFLISPKGEKVVKIPAWILNQVGGASFTPALLRRSGYAKAKGGRPGRGSVNTLN
jgi:hypothetical protein